VAWTNHIPEQERTAFIDDVLDRYGRLDEVAGQDVRIFRFYQLAAFLGVTERQELRRRSV
jgi:hypothetical protein